jgi:hypothetical protein
VRRPDDADLQKAKDFVKKYPGFKVSLEGYTDSIGSDEYNQGLSERRAEAVKEHLVADGVESARIQTSGHGESNPVGDNSTEQGRFENRRVEILILSEWGSAEGRRVRPAGRPHARHPQDRPLARHLADGHRRRRQVGDEQVDQGGACLELAHSRQGVISKPRTRSWAFLFWSRGALLRSVPDGLLEWATARPPDPVLANPAAERARIDAEPFSGSALALEPPVALFQGRHDVVALELRQRPRAV